MVKQNNSKEQPTPIGLLGATGFAEHHKTTSLKRWCTFLSLPSVSEYLISVDHHQIWRRHLAWSHRDGDKLRQAVTGRFASNMVFMSLLLGAEISVLFSPSRPAQLIREALNESQYANYTYFWGGIFLCTSIGLTLSTLLANFTAWATIGAISGENAHAVLRSSPGLYAAQLPARLAVLSIYSFIAWVVLLLGEILPYIWSACLCISILLLIIHIVGFYSSFGRLVMNSRAMRKFPIFEEDEEDKMTPDRLFEELLKKAVEEKNEPTPLPLYYRQHSEIRQQVNKMLGHSTIHDSGIGEEFNWMDGVQASVHWKRIMGTASARREISGGGREWSLSMPDVEPTQTMEMSDVLPQCSKSLSINKTDEISTHNQVKNDHSRRLSESYRLASLGSLDGSDCSNSSNRPRKQRRSTHRRMSSEERAFNASAVQSFHL